MEMTGAWAQATNANAVAAAATFTLQPGDEIEVAAKSTTRVFRYDLEAAVGRLAGVAARDAARREVDDFLHLVIANTPRMRKYDEFAEQPDREELQAEHREQRRHFVSRAIRRFNSRRTAAG